MPDCYYTCHLLPLDLVCRSGYSPRWLGGHLRDADAPARRDALAVHPMTCPFVTKLVAAAEKALDPAGAGAGGGVSAGDSPGTAAGAVEEAGAAGAAAGPSSADCLVVPGGCDAMRRLGDLLTATYPGRVFTLSMPRSSGEAVAERLAADLRRLEEWLTGRLEDSRRERVAAGAAAAAAGESAAAAAAGPAPATGLAPTAEPASVEYPAPPRPGGVFVVAGPLSDDSLLDLIHRLGLHVSGLESCTSPDRWRPLLAACDPGTGDDPGSAEPGCAGDDPTDYRATAAQLLATGMCPRRSTVERREHLSRRLDEAKPSSIIYARQSFCDPGAYDALLVAQLAEERRLPYLEIEVDFPFDANGPLRTRVEAFLEAQLLDDDLLGDDLLGDAGDLGDDLFAEED